MIIKRAITKELRAQLQEYPIVTILGPRQSGKTTLVRNVLADWTYVSLEDYDNRQYALEDPKAFLRQYHDKVIFDEVQRVPQLLSYLQTIVDESAANNRFVLTGSHQLSLRTSIAQSLAGRTGILYLLPFSIAELASADIQFAQFEEYAFNGFMPRIYDHKQRPRTAYANYYQTYIERDVRQLIKIKEINVFEKFIKLLAGRAGQIINYQSLSNDVGVSNKTIKHWLSILEASFVIFKLSPYFNNFGKRVIKSPKYYWTDVGLLSYLLEIQKPSQVTRDPLVGSIFENLVILELLKNRYNKGLNSNLYFFRDNHGNELDLLYKDGNNLVGIEIKSAATWHNNFSSGLRYFVKNNANLTHKLVIYNGKPMNFSDGVKAISYQKMSKLRPLYKYE